MRCYDNTRLALLFWVEKKVTKRPPVPFRLLSIQVRRSQVLLMLTLIPSMYSVLMILSTPFYNGSAQMTMFLLTLKVVAPFIQKTERPLSARLCCA